MLIDNIVGPGAFGWIYPYMARTSIRKVCEDMSNSVISINLPVYVTSLYTGMIASSGYILYNVINSDFPLREMGFLAATNLASLGYEKFARRNSP